MRSSAIKSFFQKPLASILLASLACILPNTHAQAQYVHTEGTKIVDGSGKPLFFNGINLGNWLLWEGYLMVGEYGYRTHTQLFNSLKPVLGGMDQAMAFEHQWRLNYVTEQMIKDLKDKGYNSVRVPFNYNMFWYNGAVSDRGFEYLDKLINYCRIHNIYILLDMHAAPGYQNPGDHSDNVNVIPGDGNDAHNRATVKFWEGNNVDIASQVWRHIAYRYRNEPIVWGYDLINEPVPQGGQEYKLLPSLVKMRDAIRQVDNNHIIVAEGSWWASDLQKLDWTDTTTQNATGVRAKWDNNLVYQIHHYPGSEGAIQDMFPRVDLTNRLGIPMILGEIGEVPEDWLRTMSNWAAQNTAGYFPWTAKKVSFEGALWTVKTNSIFDSVMAAIKQKPINPPFINGAAQGMVDFAQRNIANGASNLHWNQSYANAVKLKSGTPNLAGRYYLKNRNSGLVLDVTGASVANGAPLQQWNSGNTTNQQFDLIDNGNGIYAIKNVNSGKVLDVSGVSQSNDAVIQQWDFFGAANQLFAIVKQPNENYYQIIAKHSGRAVEVRWASLNASAAIQQYMDNNQLGSQWELVPVAAGMNFKREAEDFTAASAVQTEATNDPEGVGRNVGWIDAGDWMAYSSVKFPVSGYYTFSFRVASPYSGKNISIDLNAGTTQLGKLDVRNTGGWQNWTTVTKTGVWVNAGTHSVGITTDTGGWNINWFKIVKE